MEANEFLKHYLMVNEVDTEEITIPFKKVVILMETYYCHKQELESKVTQKDPEGPWPEPTLFDMDKDF